MIELIMMPEVTYNARITSDYIARGTSQTFNQPGYSVGVDATSGSFYVGIWTSNVDFGDGTSQEIDVYGGYRTTFKDWNLDFGVATYNYLDDPVSYEMVEALIKVNRTFDKTTISGTVAYSPDYFNVSGKSLWTEVSVSYAINDKLSISSGLAHQEIEQEGQSYSTYNVGATYSLTPSLSLDARYADTDAHEISPLYEPTFSVGITKVF